jgi:hypothetical protein
MTSDAEGRREWGHLDALHELIDAYVIPVLENYRCERMGAC